MSDPLSTRASEPFALHVSCTILLPYLDFGLQDNVGIAVVGELEDTAEPLHRQFTHLQHLELWRLRSDHWQ